MKSFQMSFVCDNAAFDEDLPRAIAKVLREQANWWEEEGHAYPKGVYGSIQDVNGNTIGSKTLHVYFDEDEECEQ